MVERQHGDPGRLRRFLVFAAANKVYWIGAFFFVLAVLAVLLLLPEPDVLPPFVYD